MMVVQVPMTTVPRRGVIEVGRVGRQDGGFAVVSSALQSAARASSWPRGQHDRPATLLRQRDTPYYVGFEAESQQIGLAPTGGPQGLASPVAYWHVSDPAHDVGGGRLVATVTDLAGNVLGLIQDPH
jgi:hypothetical protein